MKTKNQNINNLIYYWCCCHFFLVTIGCSNAQCDSSYDAIVSEQFSSQTSIEILEYIIDADYQGTKQAEYYFSPGLLTFPQDTLIGVVQLKYIRLGEGIKRNKKYEQYICMYYPACYKNISGYELTLSKPVYKKGLRRFFDRQIQGYILQGIIFIQKDGTVIKPYAFW